MRFHEHPIDGLHLAAHLGGVVVAQLRQAVVGVLLAEGNVAAAPVAQHEGRLDGAEGGEEVAGLGR